MKRTRRVTVIMQIAAFCAIAVWITSAVAGTNLVNSRQATPARLTGRQNNTPAVPVSSGAAAVPQIIQFSGTLSGTPSGTVSITFTLYENEQGGTALWSETQNVQVDAQGHYTALLGSTSTDGLPLSLFTTVQAHWLEVQPLLQGASEQPRVLLVSAPYALKAGDAETIGGLPPSAFVRADASLGASGTAAVPTTTSSGTTFVTTAASRPSAPPTTPANYNVTTGYQINGSYVVETPGSTSAPSTALGSLALVHLTTGLGDVGAGFSALFNDTTGGSNTAMGFGAMNFNTSGSANTAVGTEALYNNTTANNNVALGGVALFNNTTGANNTATGTYALNKNTTGANNTATGYYSLYNNTTGSDNMAAGYYALYSNTTGSYSTAIGPYSLYSDTTGGADTGFGYGSLFKNTSGSYNAALGSDSLLNSSTGIGNTAIGANALLNNTTGSNSIAIGYQAATNVSAGNGSNIEIGSLGSSSDNGAIRIGTSGTQTSFFAAGVRSVTTGQNNGIPVLIDSNGQLGTVSSSRRFKEDIQDMGAASDGLMRLRPVTFRYKQPFDDGSKPIQYGLIAEEVAQVYPDLVAHSADGQIETVKYQLLDPMLLNEAQRQQAEIRNLQNRLKAQQALALEQQNLLRAQQTQIRELASQMKIIQASLRTRRGSGSAMLSSAKGTPAPAPIDASWPSSSSARGGN